MKKLLIVDDSWVARMGLSKVLVPHFNVVEAESGQIALEILENQEIDIIILDLLMPGIDGYRVLEVLKSNGSSIPVIVLSADIQETTQKRVLQLGAKYFLNKPPKPAHLLEVLNSLLSETK